MPPVFKLLLTELVAISIILAAGLAGYVSVMWPVWVRSSW